MQHKRIRRPAAALLTTTLALGVAATAPATAWADPAPPPAPKKEVPVDGGFVKLTLDAQLLGSLKAKGIAVTQLTPQCRVPKDPKGEPYVPPVTALSLGVKSGAVAAVDAKLGGKLSLAETCLGLVNVKTKAGVTLSGLEADLSSGTLNASLRTKKGVTKVKLGTFERPALDKKTVDTASNSVTLDAAVKVDADLAAPLNADLGVQVFTKDAPLLTAATQLSLQGDANLSVDLGLNVNTEVSTGLDLGVILGGLLGIK